MISHLFKLVWNRRRSHALMLVEILISFLVLTSVVTVFVHHGTQMTRPIGFEYKNVWEVVSSSSAFRGRGGDDGSEARAVLQQLLDNIRAMPEIQFAALSSNTPFSNTSIVNSTYIDGKQDYVRWSRVTHEVRDILRLDLVEGEWPDRSWEELGYAPMVLNRRLAEGLFPGESAVGRVWPEFDENGNPKVRDEGDTEHRIVGIVSEYRRKGEMSESENVAFVLGPLSAKDKRPPEWFLIRLQPGTTAAFEEKLVDRLQNTAPDWTFTVNNLEDAHRRTNREYLIPMMIMLTIALFLLIMVGMGLIGVLWQNVIRRTSELGLRRALGASAPGVRRQVLGELLALATIAILVGTFLYIQVPVLGLFGRVETSTFLIALVIAHVMIYSFIVACGLYPSWLATRIEPSQALQCE